MTANNTFVSLFKNQLQSYLEIDSCQPDQKT